MQSVALYHEFISWQNTQRIGLDVLESVAVLIVLTGAGIIWTQDYIVKCLPKDTLKSGIHMILIGSDSNRTPYTRDIHSTP